MQDEAFFVKSDRTTMTQDDIDSGRGIIFIYIRIALVKPSEFVIFRITITDLSSLAIANRQNGPI
jgi:Bacteriophage tail sheath protein